MPSLWKLLGACCCCSKGGEDDDHEHLINDGADALGGGIGDDFQISHTEGPSDINAPQTRDQLEERLLKTIVDRTAKQVVDVDEMPTSPEALVVARRAQAYQTAVSAHDHRATRLPAISTLLDHPNAGVLAGESIYDWNVSEEDIDILTKWSLACKNALNAGIRIEQNSDLVVSFDFD